MNLDETQILENAENNSVSGTLVLKEVNRDVNLNLKPEELSNTNTLMSVGNQSQKIKAELVKKPEISHFCIKLLNPSRADNVEHPILPLMSGLNKIGRSNSSDICILDKNLSKVHASIEISENNAGELLECSIRDCGSLNKLKINGNKLIDTNECSELKINDIIFFGMVILKFIKMSDLEYNEQKENPRLILDLTETKTKTSPKKANTNGTTKLNNLFEIQNTLDDTCLIETSNGSDDSIKENDQADDDINKFYVADTDPEDEDQDFDRSIDMSASIHLEMSQSILMEASMYSNKSRHSLYIPDTMDQSYEIENDTEVITNTKENSNNIFTDMLPPPLPIDKNDSATVKLEETNIIDETINESPPKSESKKTIVEETVILVSNEISTNGEEAVDLLIEKEPKVTEAQDTNKTADDNNISMAETITETVPIAINQSEIDDDKKNVNKEVDDLNGIENSNDESKEKVTVTEDKAYKTKQENNTEVNGEENDKVSIDKKLEESKSLDKLDDSKSIEETLDNNEKSDEPEKVIADKVESKSDSIDPYNELDGSSSELKSPEIESKAEKSEKFETESLSEATEESASLDKSLSSPTKDIPVVKESSHSESMSAECQLIMKSTETEISKDSSVRESSFTVEIKTNIDSKPESLTTSPTLKKIETTEPSSNLEVVVSPESNLNSSKSIIKSPEAEPIRNSPKKTDSPKSVLEAELSETELKKNVTSNEINKDCSSENQSKLESIDIQANELAVKKSTEDSKESTEINHDKSPDVAIENKTNNCDIEEKEKSLNLQASEELKTENEIEPTKGNESNTVTPKKSSKQVEPIEISSISLEENENKASKVLSNNDSIKEDESNHKNRNIHVNAEDSNIEKTFEPAKEVTTPEKSETPISTEILVNDNDEPEDIKNNTKESISSNEEIFSTAPSLETPQKITSTATELPSISEKNELKSASQDSKTSKTNKETTQKTSQEVFRNNEEILVECTLLDTSVSKAKAQSDAIDQSQRIELSDYPELFGDKSEVEEEAEHVAPKKRGRKSKKIEIAEEIEPNFLQSRSTRRSTRAAAPAKQSAKPAKKRSIESIDESNLSKESGDQEDEQATEEILTTNKKVEPAKKGRRKTIQVAVKDIEETETKAESTTVTSVVTKKSESAKRGRRKTLAVSSEDVKSNEALSVETTKTEETITDKEKVEVSKKPEPAKRGRPKTVVVVPEDIKAAKSMVTEDTEEAKSSENLEVVKKEPAKRGRRKTAVNAEDINTALKNDKEDTEETESITSSKPGRKGRKSKESDKENTLKTEEPETPAKPTLGRRASLRTRPTISTPAKEPIVKKIKAKAIEESPAKGPGKAKVTRRNSVAVTASKKSPAKATKVKSKSEEEPLKEESEEEEEEEAQPIQTARKTKRTNPIKASRRQTIAVVTKDVAEATSSFTARKTKSPKAKATVKKIDTFSYDESDKSETDEPKKTKKKRNQTEISTSPSSLNENEKKKLKGTGKNKQKESESEQETTVTSKKRAPKRKSGETKAPSAPLSTEEPVSTTSTPKIFFHSKRVKTTPPSTSRVNGKEPKTVYSSFLNTPTKTDKTLDSSINNGTPSKKFKLLKGLKSSSSSNNSSDDEIEKSNKKQTAKPSENHSLPSTADTTSTKVSNKHVKIKLPNDSEIHDTRPQVSDNLNKTIDHVGVKPAKPKAKSTRHSLGSIRGSSALPKIMCTGIMLTDKEKQIVKNLSGEIVTDVRECTHLITNKIRKTFKFLSCLNRSVHIIGDRWLEESNKAKMFLSPLTYILSDSVTEKQYKFSLQTSLLKAKSNPLFQDWTFLLKYEDSKDEELTYSNIQTIIECGNGKVVKSVPKKATLLENFCIVFESQDKYNKDKESSSLNVSKILLDTLLTCIYKQSFDASHMIQADGEEKKE